MCVYLAVQLPVQLADALSQLGQLLSDDGMVDDLGGVRLHVKALRQEVHVALCKQGGSGNKPMFNASTTRKNSGN